MSGYFRQMRSHHNEAEAGLRERLAREEMGDDAYEKMVAKGDDGTFKWVGLALFVIFAGVVLGVTALGY